MKVKVKTEDAASELSLFIVCLGVIMIVILMELPAWVYQYGWNFWSVLQ